MYHIKKMVVQINNHKEIFFVKLRSFEEQGNRTIKTQKNDKL